MRNIKHLIREQTYKPKNASINRLLKDYEETHFKIFRRVIMEWAPRIRDFLREETGLLLHSKRSKDPMLEIVPVGIDIEPDFEYIFAKLVDKKFEHMDFDKYCKLRKFMENMHEHEKFFEGESEKGNIRALIEYCSNYFKENDINMILDKLFKSRERGMEIYGAYIFGRMKIELYYLPILLLCRIKETDIEYTAAVILAHELAHAYHHVGKDKDGVTWNTFTETNSEITEGLAQYYALRFVEEYESQFKGLREAYNGIIFHQEGVYRIHEDWIKKYKNEHVRFALIAARRNSIVSYIDFQEILKKSSEMVKTEEKDYANEVMMESIEFVQHQLSSKKDSQ